MQIKEVSPINFLYYRTEVRVNELGNFLYVGQELYREAVYQKLDITGPIHWHYIGFNSNANNRFILEIGLPVAEVLNEYDGEFHFKRTEVFKCVSLMHEGSWFDIPRSYQMLHQYIREKSLSPVGRNREIYINTDFKVTGANVTEIQIGIS